MHCHCFGLAFPRLLPPSDDHIGELSQSTVVEIKPALNIELEWTEWSLPESLRLRRFEPKIAGQTDMPSI